MRAMILAAGRGVRMGPLTADKPKPLVTVAGMTLIERQLRGLRAAGISDIVINLSYRGEQIRSAVGDGRALGLRVVYSQEPDEPLETAGGIIEALPLLGDEPFVVANADVVTDFDFKRLERPRGLGELVLVDNPAHHPQGDYGIGGDGKLTHAAPKLTYAGIAALNPQLFADLARGRRPLVPLLDAAIAKGMLYGQKHAGLWFDVGTPERADAAARALGAD